MTLALAAGVGGGAAAAPPGGDGAGGSAVSGGGSTVTLLTGDRVTLAPDGSVSAVHPAPGRENVPVRVLETDDATLVVPRDAVAMIADGTLQRSLFDVAELSRPQYERFAGTPLIVGYEDGSTSSRSALRAAPAVEFRAALDVLDADALTLSEESGSSVWEALTATGAGTDDLARTTAPGIDTVSLDRVVRGSLDTSTAQVGAPAAWEAGLDGTGVTIAVLDSGIAADHGDFDGRVRLAENFTDAPDAEDRYGHGTHVASIAAGSGDRSGGALRGVAPGADLLNGKVLGDDNTGMESWVIEGMEWAAASGARIINLSLGDVVPEGPDPMAEALDRIAQESDALFVVAAGNSGPGDRTVDSPGVADAALTVGSVTAEDQISPFSAAGPRTGDGALKPELTAPGSDIGAAAAEGSFLAGAGRPVADGYVATSGTSMAAPHVAGAAALLAQRDPELTGARLKALLTSSALGLQGPAPTQQGTGRLDIERALQQSVTADTTTLDFGSVQSPTAEAEPVSRDLTYRNDGDEDAELGLVLDSTGPGGDAPEEMFTLDRETVEVPAGGEATVTVTAVPAAANGEIGDYGVFVTASSDDHRVRAAGTVELEPAYADLTVEVTDREGGAPESGEVLLLDLAAGGLLHAEVEDGRVTTRLPEGDYLLQVQADRSDEDTLVGADLAVHPSLALSADTTVEIAMADAEEVDFVAPGGDEPAGTVAGWDVVHPAAGSISQETSFPALPQGVRTLSLEEPGEETVLRHHVATSHRADDGSHAYLYATGDGWPTGLVNRPDADDMAELTARLGASAPGTTGVLGVLAGSGLTAGSVPVDLPAEQVLRVQAAHGWSLLLEQFAPGADEPVAAHRTPERDLSGGGRHEETLNVGVFGPVLGESSGLFQSGESLVGLVTHFTDGAGNEGSVAAAGSTVLHRNGEILTEYPGTAEWFDSRLPAGEAEYRLVSTAAVTEPEHTAVSTEITLDYTFTTAPVEGFEPIAGPLAVRYSPDLALDSTAPAKEKQTVPLAVTGGEAALLTVEASFDRGESWEELKVHTKDAGDLVHIHNPAAGGSVSLRATAEDADGNRSVQTILDAYLTR